MIFFVLSFGGFKMFLYVLLIEKGGDRHQGEWSLLAIMFKEHLDRFLSETYVCTYTLCVRVCVSEEKGVYTVV